MISKLKWGKKYTDFSENRSDASHHETRLRHYKYRVRTWAQRYIEETCENTPEKTTLMSSSRIGDTARLTTSTRVKNKTRYKWSQLEFIDENRQGDDTKKRVEITCFAKDCVWIRSHVELEDRLAHTAKKQDARQSSPKIFPSVSWQRKYCKWWTS